VKVRHHKSGVLGPTGRGSYKWIIIKRTVAKRDSTVLDFNSFGDSNQCFYMCFLHNVCWEWIIVDASDYSRLQLHKSTSVLICKSHTRSWNAKCYKQNICEISGSHISIAKDATLHDVTWCHWLRSSLTFRHRASSI